jgi:maleylpyruvate isomerase
VTTLDEARAVLRLHQGQGARYDAPEAPAVTLGAVRLGTAYFARKLNELPDAALSAPSALPGKCRAQVVAGVALQARAICWQIEDEGEGAQDAWSAAYLADVDSCATLPPRALRHLFDHSAIHLNVVWRDLPGPAWTPALRETADSRARFIWQAALHLGNGARPRDLPAKFRP